MAKAFKDFCTANGIKHIKSAPYHPDSNGLVECFVQILNEKPTLNGWRSTDYPHLLLSYLTTPYATTQVAICELLYQNLYTRFNLLKPETHWSVIDLETVSRWKTGLRMWSEGDDIMVLDFRQG